MDYRNEPPQHLVSLIWNYLDVSFDCGRVRAIQGPEAAEWTTEEGFNTWCISAGSYVMYPGRLLKKTIAKDTWVDSWVVEKVEGNFDYALADVSIDSSVVLNTVYLSDACAYLISRWIEEHAARIIGGTVEATDRILSP